MFLVLSANISGPVNQYSWSSRPMILVLQANIPCLFSASVSWYPLGQYSWSSHTSDPFSKYFWSSKPTGIPDPFSHYSWSNQPVFLANIYDPVNQYSSSSQLIFLILSANVPGSLSQYYWSSQPMFLVLTANISDPFVNISGPLSQYIPAFLSTQQKCTFPYCWHSKYSDLKYSLGTAQ